MTDNDNRSSEDQQPLDEILAELMRASDAGQVIDSRHWLARYPEFAGELQEFFEQQERVERLVRPLRHVAAKSLHVRCPHCHNPIELLDDAALAEISCPSCGSSFSLVGDVTVSHYQPGERTVGHFQLLDRVGVGQFGSVWKARDTKLDRTVAIKIPRNSQLDGSQAELFLRDARAAAQLKHPNIVGVHEVGKQDQTVYIVSDFVHGATLKEWLAAKRPTPSEAAQLCAKIAKALHHAHEAGVIHRDLKPSNIMMDTDGEPHIVDFGLAKRETGEITMTVDGQILGTPAYMSPEQAQGKGHSADRRTDVYSLGVILFELLTGELPFRGDKQMLILQIIEGDPVGPRKLNSAVAQDLDTITLNCLDRDPAKRFPTAMNLAEDLTRFNLGEPIRSRPIGVLARGWRWCKRKPTIAMLSGSTIALLFAITILATAGYFREASLRERAETGERNARNALARNSELKASVDDLEKQLPLLESEVSSGQRLLARTYTRLAGNLLEEGKHKQAEAYLLQCPKEHRSWEWHFYLKLCRPRLLELNSSQLAQLESGDLQLRLPRHTIEFRDQSESAVEESDGGDRIRLLNKILHGRLKELPPGRMIRESASYCPTTKRTAVAVRIDGGNSRNIQREIIVLSMETERIKFILPYDGDAHSRLQFSMDGRWLLSSNSTGGTLWDVAADWKGLSIGRHVGTVYRLAFDPNSRYLTSAPGHIGKQKADPDSIGIKQWRILDGEELFGFLKPHGPEDTTVYSVSLAPNGEQMASVSQNSTKFWNLASRKETNSIEKGGRDIQHSPDGTFLAVTGNGATWIWSVLEHREVFRLDEGGTGVGISPDNQTIAIATGQGKEVLLWKPVSGEELRRIGTAYTANRLEFSPSGQELAVAEGNTSETETVEIFDLSNGEKRLFSSGGGKYVFDVAWSPDGQLIASAHWDAVYVIDAKTGHQVIKLHVPSIDDKIRNRGRLLSRQSDVWHRGYCVAFSPNGKYLAAGWGMRDKNNVIIWDTGIGQESLASIWISNSLNAPE